VEDLEAVIFWEERWHLQHNRYEFPVVELVDYRRLLQFVDPEWYTRSRTNGFAIRDQRMRASEAIPWPVVDERGNTHALNVDSGLFEQTGIAEKRSRKEKVEHYSAEAITALISPKTLPSRFIRQALPQETVDVDFPFLYFKLQAFRCLAPCENDTDWFVRAWAANQLQVRHPFMYQALLAEKWIFTVEDLRVVYGGKLGWPGWHWANEWPE